MLYLLCGIPFAGKTTLAKELSRTFGWLIIDLDEVKFAMLGRTVKDGDVKQQQWDEVYREMYRQIKMHLEQGETVIHDTGNFTKTERELVRQIAKGIGVPTATIWVKTDVALARRRLRENENLKNRFFVSEISFDEAVAEMESPTDTEDEKLLVFDNSELMQDWIKRLL